MALVKFSALVADVSGAIGGVIFSRNRSGATVRNKTVPTSPITAASSAVKAAFGFLSALWRSLSEAQRQSWQNAVENFPYSNKLGEARLYSGQQLYMKLNRVIQVVGGNLLETAPAPVALPVMVGVSLAFGPDPFEMLVNFDELDTTPNGAYVLDATPPLSPGIDRPSRGLFKLIEVNSVAGLTTGFDVGPGYEGVFGIDFPVGTSKIFYRIRFVDQVTGQSGPVTIFSTTINIEG